MVYSYLEKLYTEYLEEKKELDKTIAKLYAELQDDMEDNQKTKIRQIERAKKQQEKIVQKLEELAIVRKSAVYDDNVCRMKLLEAQENERQRISRELHDSTVQNLTSIIHKAELCGKLIEKDPIRCKLELTAMEQTLRDTIQDTRQMIYNLRPMSFDDIGLDITIERAIDKIRNDKSCKIAFKVQGQSRQIDSVVGITILRIIQEACNNAVKYAQANLIFVKLIYAEDSICISVEDDGKGFDVERFDASVKMDNSGFGISMMKERVYLLSGDIEITSKKNAGTKIYVKVPI